MQFVSYGLSPAAHMASFAKGVYFLISNITDYETETNFDIIYNIFGIGSLVLALICLYWMNFKRFMYLSILSMILTFILFLLIICQVIYVVMSSNLPVKDDLTKQERQYDYRQQSKMLFTVKIIIDIFLLLMPMIAFSFQFELCLIPVQCHMKIKDWNGVQGFKSSLISLSIALAFHIWIFFFLFQVDKYVSDIKCVDCQLYMVIYRHFQIIISILSLLIISFTQMIQGILTLHLAHEQFCILIDEVFRESLTLNIMKSRIKIEEDDKNKLLESFKSEETFEDNKVISYLNGQIFTLQIFKEQKYWMAYMDMDKATTIKAALILVFINIVVLTTNTRIYELVSILGCVATPMVVYIIPGYLYHTYQKHQIIIGEIKVQRGIYEVFPLIFCLIGILIIMINSSSVLLNLAISLDLYEL
ncbi:UNKNOWN [Stylonychia lemnae]|uniref:Uncharacterized protein n=1 Tax=Stylonychia lemnae TaxID=5949 RepID=A0A078AQT9_STYLE|nr:UNKNOWN [Stylonychia lemnae]|eukprot:CDW84584.1 UNKNOWN [Stylonychia lemnae]